MSRLFQVALGTLVVLLLILGPVAFGLHEQAQTKKFRVVQPHVLYRSGQMTRAGLKRILNDYGIKTVINLRDGQTAPDKAEEAFLNSEEVTFVRILPSHWGDVGGSIPVEEGVRKFRSIMSDPRNYPVLIHCFAGIHRTGAYCAIYRMEFEHWSNADAIAEVKACGYTNLDEELDILGYLEQYRPTWLPRAEAPPAEEKSPRSKKGHHPKAAAGSHGKQPHSAS
jgi:tyrosine-protein phosphatase SIW14